MQVIEVSAQVSGTIPAVDYGNITFSVGQKATLEPGEDPEQARAELLRSCKASLMAQAEALPFGYRTGNWLKAVEAPAAPTPSSPDEVREMEADDEHFNDDDFEEDGDDFEDDDDASDEEDEDEDEELAF